jgi:hypothetical protein
VDHWTLFPKPKAVFRFQLVTRIVVVLLVVLSLSLVVPELLAQMAAT